MKTVRGTYDLFGEKYDKHQWIVNSAQEVATHFGCKGIETPIFEFSSVFHRTLGETSDIVSKETYTFEDRSGESLTLRPEATAPIARAFASHHFPTPAKLFYAGPMFRYERPQKGRHRQFYQLGVEFMGATAPTTDIEILSLATLLFEKWQLQDGLRLEINSIGSTESRTKYREALLAYFQKFKKDLSQDSQRRLTMNPLRILDSKDKSDIELLSSTPQISDFLSAEEQAQFEECTDGLKALNISFEINPRLVRGLDYYNDLVFEFKHDQLAGAQNTLLGGGRYDGLIEQMGGRPTACVGFAAGIERLTHLIAPPTKHRRPFVFVPMGEAATKKTNELAHHLRDQGLYIELTYSGNVSKRLTKANKMNAVAAILLGDNELAEGAVSIKDFDRGTESSVKLDQLAETLKGLG